MKPAVSLWNLIHEDRIFRWATYAAIVVIWFSIAWAEVRFLGGLLLIAAVVLVASPAEGAPRLARRA